MAQKPRDPVTKRLWIKLILSLALLVAVAIFIAMLKGGRIGRFDVPPADVTELAIQEARGHSSYVWHTSLRTIWASSNVGTRS
jgi:hypothetical protein